MSEELQTTILQEVTVVVVIEERILPGHNWDLSLTGHGMEVIQTTERLPALAA